MARLLSRMCVCGHDIGEHKDYDFDIHECNHTGCTCQQFRDADDDSTRPQPQPEGDQ